jgi:hypothetical protein
MTEEAKGTAIAPVQTGGPLDFGGLDAQLFSTFPAEDKARVVALMQGKAKPLAEAVGQEITVVHILAHSVETVTEDGEVLGLLRIVLAGPNGEAWQTTSEGIRNSVRIISKYYGRPPWTNGLKLKVESVRTRRGRNTFTLSPV